MNTIGSHTSLGDLVSYNTSKQTTPAQTTTADAQSTLSQVPSQILASVSPSNTYYGVAPTNDSLLGNVGTSAALEALAQINSTRSASTQISPYGSSSDASAAVADAQQAQQSAKATILASDASLVGGSSSAAIPSEYYELNAPAILSTLAPSLTFSSSAGSDTTAGVVLPTSS